MCFAAFVSFRIAGCSPGAFPVRFHWRVVRTKKNRGRGGRCPAPTRESEAEAEEGCENFLLV